MKRLTYLAAMAAGAAIAATTPVYAEPTEGRWAYCYVEHGASTEQYTVSKLFRPMAEPGWYDSKGQGALETLTSAFKAAVEAEQTGRKGSHKRLIPTCEADASFYAISDRRSEKLRLRSTGAIEWPAANAVLVASPATEAPLMMGAAENAQHLLAYTLEQYAANERTHEYMAPELKKALEKQDLSAVRAAGPVQDIKLLRAEPDGHLFEVRHANGVMHWKVGQKNLFLTQISHSPATGQ